MKRSGINNLKSVKLTFYNIKRNLQLRLSPRNPCAGVNSVSNPGFPEPETHFFGYFLLPETRVFLTTKPGCFKNR